MAEMTVNNPEAKKAKRSTKIKWDEETIAEHDKLRGTREKIDEPSTPYHYFEDPSESDLEGRDSDAANAAVEPMDTQETSQPSAPGSGAPSGLATTGGGLGVVSGGVKDKGKTVPRSPDESYQPPPTDLNAVEARLQGLSGEGGQVRAKKSSWDEAEEGGGPPSGGSGGMTPEEFRKKRAAHYNEFMKLKQWREQHPSDEDEEDEETDKGGNDGSEQTGTAVPAQG
mmetsp:Transcript_686/g.1005  ORF Transcript_686/g.1005 Transcript_686/m.1005 type:complete len:226 (-) Transcript_686:108-785(-)|eukprot:CAMPEP_0113939482 /NCGR_PEP_ID=MMETSP1339-20121228/5793_1 /TAXON_ID=94617 /ORGANISM="Fibrocapsa japonica" /LENGTH=225 /DNA_ID=CAMNT_0000942991 /DNA_START=82 /DNA_END=759 /DNA_ORIENTATION=+ /assembly_acc=CAM_ASM_000762